MITISKGMWRNWQPRQIQNLFSVMGYGFKSRLAHNPYLQFFGYQDGGSYSSGSC